MLRRPSHLYRPSLRIPRPGEIWARRAGAPPRRGEPGGGNTPLVARTRVDLSPLSSVQIEEVVSASASESHSLYLVDAELMDELRPDLVITQDICAVCAVSSGDLATACPVGAELYSMNPRSFGDVVASVVELATRLDLRERGAAIA